jgi:hypothetical protein
MWSLGVFFGLTCCLSVVWQDHLSEIIGPAPEPIWIVATGSDVPVLDCPRFACARNVWLYEDQTVQVIKYKAINGQDWFKVRDKWRALGWIRCYGYYGPPSFTVRRAGVNIVIC